MARVTAFTTGIATTVQTWECPADGIYLVECWGAGGHGGVAGMGGGGGGYAADLVSLVGGVTYNIQVPNTLSGRDTAYLSPSNEVSSLVLAASGYEGGPGQNDGTGGAASECVGTVKKSGGNGGAAVAGSCGSGGGGTAGSGYIGQVVNAHPTLATNGGNGTLTVPGTRGGGVGVGGIGGAVGAKGTDGIVPGGGAGGTGDGGAGFAKGAVGSVQITAFVGTEEFDACGYNGENETTTTGTGDLAIGDATDGFDSLLELDGQTLVYYTITSQDRTIVYERGVGYLDSYDGTLVRNIVLWTLDGNSDLYDLPAGTKLIRTRLFSLDEIVVLGGPGGPGDLTRSGGIVNEALLRQYEIEVSAALDIPNLPAGVMVSNGGFFRTPPPGQSGTIITLPGGRRIALPWQYMVPEIDASSSVPTWVALTETAEFPPVAASVPNATRNLSQITVPRESASAVYIRNRQSQPPPAGYGAIPPGGRLGCYIGSGLPLAPAVIDAVTNLIIENFYAGAAAPVNLVAMMGRLSLTTDGGNSDAARTGLSSIVKLVPVGNNPSAVMTLWHDARPGLLPAWHDEPLVNRITGRLNFQVNLNDVSPIPFNYVSTAVDGLPDQSTTKANVPADLFACQGLEQGVYQLFYVNWADSTHRKVGNLGHSLVKRNGLWCLNTASVANGGFVLNFREPFTYGAPTPGSGVNSFNSLDWFFDPSRFVYLGTVCSPIAGFCFNIPFHRGLWNVFNRLDYTDVLDDATAFWLINPLSAMGDFDAINPSRNAACWQHTWVNGADPSNQLYGNCPTCSATVTGYGGVQINLTKYKINSLGDIEQGQFLASAVTGQVVAPEAMAIDPTATYEVRDAEQAGFNFVRIEQGTWQSRGDLNWGFFGSGRPMRYNAANGIIREACDGDPDTTDQTAGPARFIAIGSC